MGTEWAVCMISNYSELTHWGIRIPLVDMIKAMANTSKLALFCSKDLHFLRCSTSQTSFNRYLRLLPTSHLQDCDAKVYVFSCHVSNFGRCNYPFPTMSLQITEFGLFNIIGIFSKWVINYNVPFYDTSSLYISLEISLTILCLWYCYWIWYISMDVCGFARVWWRDFKPKPHYSISSISWANEININ